MTWGVLAEKCAPLPAGVNLETGQGIMRFSIQTNRQISFSCLFWTHLGGLLLASDDLLGFEDLLVPYFP